VQLFGHSRPPGHQTPVDLDGDSWTARMRGQRWRDRQRWMGGQQAHPQSQARRKIQFHGSTPAIVVPIFAWEWAIPS
jgi:hypothetical protein